MCLNPFCCQTSRLFTTNGAFCSLSANNHGGQNRTGVLIERNDMCLNPSCPQAHRLYSTDGVFALLQYMSNGGQDQSGVFIERNDKKSMNDQLDPDIADMEYIVRRLMPVECERLQGLPDDYTTVHFTEEMIDDKMLDDFIAIKLKWDTMNAKVNKTVKPKTRAQMKRWILGISANPPDSPRYKACGNGWACNQPRWIVMNILNTFHPGWDEIPDCECDVANGINPQNGSLMFPCSHEVAQTLAVGHGGGLQERRR